MRKGHAYHGKLMTLRCLSTPAQSARFGFVLGKHVGGAVVRNKAKRRLKELARASQVAPGWDLVVVARETIGAATFAQLREEFQTLLLKAGLALRK